MQFCSTLCLHYNSGLYYICLIALMRALYLYYIAVLYYILFVLQFSFVLHLHHSTNVGITVYPYAVWGAHRVLQHQLPPPPLPPLLPDPRRGPHQGRTPRPCPRLQVQRVQRSHQTRRSSRRSSRSSRSSSSRRSTSSRRSRSRTLLHKQKLQRNQNSLEREQLTRGPSLACREWQ